MGTFVMRDDAVVVEGSVAYCWKDAWTALPLEQEWNWHIVVQLAAGDPLLVAANGATNWLGMIDCRVSPVAPFRDEPWASQMLSGLNGKRVRISGTWGDETDGAGSVRTVVRPIGWIVAENEELSVIVEEHGFTQVVRDIDLFAFSDDSAITATSSAPPHHQADRNFVVPLQFPFKPQAEAEARHSECVDRDNIEQMLYFGRTTSRPRFPLKQLRNYSSAVSNVAGTDVLTITLDTGTPAAGQGFLFQKLALTYDEPFDEMCLPNVCLNEPGRNCQATGEDRYSWRAPRLDSVQAGDLLLGPAGSGGLIGDLLAALTGPQYYDHMVLFVENDGQTIRHCTMGEDRVSNPAYYTATVKVETPLGDMEERLPLKGIRGDVLKFGWPGSITQTLGEVCITGRNRVNPQFRYETFYPKVTAAEAVAPPRLWELDPAERDKRTSYHDPEATAKAVASKDVGTRAYYSQVRLQRDPAWRSEVDPATGQPIGFWIKPILVKPHPMLDVVVRDALGAVAEEAKKISAHYRFFAYTKSTIATDPAFDAPSESGWASGTVAAMCSSFVWAAVQAANQELSAAGKPTIELEGEGEPSDKRSPAQQDGIYLYTEDERIAAARALFDNSFKKVTKTVQDKVDELPGIVEAFADLSGVPSGLETILGSIVANQLCNIFAFDTTADLTGTWGSPGEGKAVSPDDTMLRWDVKAPADVFPPATPGGKINVYGTFAPVDIPKGGWTYEPILKINESIGFGSISGTVVRRESSGAQARRVPGATVRYGCRVTATDVEGSYSFSNVKAGVYVLRASMFILDASSKAAVEWKSEPALFNLRDGDQIDNLELELLPPPGLARDVKILTHHDVVDRVVIGKDRWGHFDLSSTINLMWDPREIDYPNVPEGQRNTVLHKAAQPIVTPEVGSGVHVSVVVNATLRPTGNPAEPFDGTVVLDTTLTFYDTGEGETNAVVTDLGRVLVSGEIFEFSYNLESDDTVSEGASGYVRLSNLWAALP